MILFLKKGVSQMAIGKIMTIVMMKPKNILVEKISAVNHLLRGNNQKTVVG